jgi:hypothetical protein
MARADTRSACQMSRTRNFTRSQARSLLSIVRLNSASSRLRCELQANSDRPDLFQFEWSLLPDKLTLVPRFATECRMDSHDTLLSGWWSDMV